MKETVKILTTLAAALLVSLLLATACTNPTNGEPGAPGAPGTPGTAGKDGADGQDGEEGKTGAPGTPGQGTGGGAEPILTGNITQAQMDALYAYVNSVTWVSGVTVATGSYEIPSGKTLAVLGDVSLSGANIEINAYKATALDLSKGRLVGGDSSDLILLNSADKNKYVPTVVGSSTAKITDAAVVPTPVESITAAIPADIVGPVLVQSLSVKGTGGTTLSQIAGYITGHDLYVMEKLVMEEDAINLPSSGDYIHVYGDIQAETALTVTDVAKLDLKGSIVAATPTLTVTGLNNLGANPLDTGSSTVSPSGTPTTITITTLNSTGTGGKLALPSSVETVAITGGTGNVVYGVIPATLQGTFGNGGTVAFPDADLTLGGALSFSGTASLFTGKGITGGAYGVTLTPGAKLAVGTADVIRNSDDTNPVIITLGTNTDKLAFTAAVVTQSGSGGHTITVSGGGTLALGSGVTYTVQSGSSNVGTLTVSAGTFDLGTGGELVLTSGTTGGTAALLKGAGKVAAGGIEIVGGGNGWEAVGTGAITISAAGVAAGTAALTAQDASSAIEVAAAGNLTVTTGKIDISAYGAVTLNPNAVLKGAGIVAGADVEISGGTNGWKAAGDAGTVAVTKSAVTVAETVAFTGLAGAAVPSILVKAAAFPVLTVTGRIDISAAGTVTLNGAGTPGSIRLATHATNPGILVVDGAKDVLVLSGSATITNSNFLLTESTEVGDTNVTVLANDGSAAVSSTGGTAVTVTAEAAVASSGSPLGKIGGGTSTGIVLKGPAATFVSVIEKGWKVKVPNS
jgi:hypothetical protein